MNELIPAELHVVDPVLRCENTAIRQKRAAATHLGIKEDHQGCRHEPPIPRLFGPAFTLSFVSIPKMKQRAVNQLHDWDGRLAERPVAELAEAFHFVYQLANAEQIERRKLFLQPLHHSHDLFGFLTHKHHPFQPRQVQHEDGRRTSSR